MSLHTKNLLKVLSSEAIKNMVKSELETYDADKTGRTDYALECSGSALFNYLVYFYLTSVLSFSQTHVRKFLLTFSAHNVLFKEQHYNPLLILYAKKVKHGL